MSRSEGTDRESEAGRRSRVESLLAIFAEIRPGEGPSVGLLFVNVFLILTAYYVLKVVREGLTIGGVHLFGLGGDEIKAYLPAVMALLLLGAVPAYGRMASAMSRIRLINTTTAFVIGTLLLFFLWGNAAGVGTAIGLSFYIYLGIVNVFLIAQFWSFANDIYTDAEGKRLFAVIAIGQSLGAVVGPQIARQGSHHIFALLIVSAGIFALCLVVYNTVDRREGRRTDATGDPGRSASRQPLGHEGGFQLVFQTRYLLLIACMILVTNVVNTTGEYILANAARSHAEEQIPGLGPERKAEIRREVAATHPGTDAPDFADALAAAEETALRGARSRVIGAFYGDFFFWVNLVGVSIQMFLVSRIFKYLGVRAALFVLPLIAFGGYAAIALLGGLTVLRFAKTAENSVDYSLQNTVKQSLFLPTSREAKYKAKAAIDTFFVRFGDAASAGIVFFGLHTLGFGPKAFALVNLGLISIWLVLVAGISREHAKLVPRE